MSPQGNCSLLGFLVFSQLMKVAIYGTGYVGLVAGVCLAKLGHQVICLDINEVRIEKLSANVCPIYEIKLDGLLTKNIASQAIQFTSDFALAANFGEIHLVCVGTPSLETGKADLTAVLSVTQSIVFELKHDATIVTKSTVPVSTGKVTILR